MLEDRHGGLSSLLAAADQSLGDLLLSLQRVCHEVGGRKVTWMFKLSGRKLNLTVRALFGWILFLSLSNVLGAAVGVSVPLMTSCVRSVLYQGDG